MTNQKYPWVPGCSGSEQPGKGLTTRVWWTRVFHGHGKRLLPPTDNRPSYLSRSRQPINKDEEEEGHRESQSSALSEQNLYGPKERFSGRQNDLGLVNPQLIHKVPILQDVNHERSEVTSSKVLLDCLSRFPRGILACIYIPISPTKSLYLGFRWKG